MRYFKIVDEYILAIGTGAVGEEITEAEYNHIKSIIDNRPTAPDGFAYRLTAELGWEMFELPTAEPIEEELSETEQKALAYDILMGVSE